MRASKSSVRLALVAVLMTAAVGCGVMADSHNVQGKKLFQSGQYDRAVASFQQALSQDAGNADACYNLASVYHHLGIATRDTSMLTQAETLYNECLNRDPNHVDCHRALAVLLVQDDRKDSAFTLLRRWAAANPLSPEPKLELARLYREFGDNQTATELIAEAIKQDPRNVRAHRAMGQIREEQGQLASALDSYQRALQANNMQADLQTKVASLQQQVAASWSTTTSANRWVQLPPPPAGSSPVGSGTPAFGTPTLPTTPTLPVSGGRY